MPTPVREISKRLSSLLLITVLTACSAPSTTPATATSRPITSATMISPPTPATARSDPSDQEIVSRSEDLLNNMIFDGAVLIARDGRVLLSKGYGEADRQKRLPNTAQTKFRIASNTKQFTSTAVLILQAHGKLNVQDHVCIYISNCPAAWKTITLHHLLTHTSGIPDYYTSPDWTAFQSTPITPTGVMSHFIDKPLDFQPGERWKYSNSGYTVLGVIIEKVSGLTYEEFVKENILAPLNMTDTGYLDNPGGMAVGYTDATTTSQADFEDASGLFASGGLYSTVEDLYLWDRALYTDKLLPQDLWQKMFTPYVSVPNMDGFGYGYGWEIGQIANHPVIAHMGRINGFSSFNTYYPDSKVAIIVLGNQQNESVFYIGEQLARIIFGAE